MNKRCARCQRTVYPVEELKCLDKSWHKGCFNCEECSMTLNMKNYKGYNKLPYCHAHYPTTKFTAVADTPESRRLAKNTLNQSQVNYQKKFVEEKGHKISVADDPETVRARRNTQNQSAVAYTGHQQQRDMSELHRPTEDPKAYTGPQQKTSVGSLFVAPDVPMAAPQPPQPQRQGARVGGAGGGRYRAIYDYQAADGDEVSLREGDIIQNGASIDEGWMTGTVQRSGQTGMLPSNYVEPF